MSLPQLRTACCGKTIRTSSLIIGFFCVIFTAFIWSFYLSFIPALYDYCDDYHSYPTKILFDRMYVSTFGMVMTYFLTIQCLFLWAVFKKIQYLMLSWIVITTVMFLLSALGSVILFILAVSSEKWLLIIFTIYNIIPATMLYFLLVVISYYRVIKQESMGSGNCELSGTCEHRELV